MAVIGGSTVSAKAKVIKSYHEGAQKDDLSISDSERKTRRFPIGVEPTDLLLLVQMLYY